MTGNDLRDPVNGMDDVTAAYLMTRGVMVRTMLNVKN